MSKKYTTMGYIKHHAIVVTSWDDDKLKAAHDKAVELFANTVSPLIESKINRYKSFFIAPDGSKEGWEDSNQGDVLRGLFINYLNSRAYEDGSNSLRYAELYYGEDNGKSEIESHN